MGSEILATITTSGILTALTGLVATTVIAIYGTVVSRPPKPDSKTLPIPDMPVEISDEIAKQILEDVSTNLSPAEVEAQAILTAYSKDLGSEAKRIANRVNAERPSKKHVRQAAERIGILRDRSGVISDTCLTLGSVLGGAGISFYVNIATGGAANPALEPWATGCLVVGTGFAVGAVVIKWRRS